MAICSDFGAGWAPGGRFGPVWVVRGSTARLADYQRWNSCKGACNRDTARNLIGKLLNTLKGHEDVLSKRAQHEGVMGENGVYPLLRDDATALELETPSLM